MGISSNRARFAAAELPRSIRRGPLTYNTAHPPSACPSGLVEAQKDKAAVLRALTGWPIITAAATRHGIDPGILAGIGVRETGYRNMRQPNGMGRGVFQIDLRANPGVTEAQAMDVAWAANWAAAQIAANLRDIQSRFPRFTQAQAMQAAVAAYNLGTRGISGNPATIDDGSPGDNYGRNVRDIATCF